MAVFPCDWSAHRYPDAQQSIYFTSVFGDLVETRKLRLCPNHLRELGARIRERMAQVDQDSTIGQNCDHCEDEKQGSLFAKVFQGHDEPVYFATDLCARCYTSVAHDLHVSSGKGLAGR